jgi:hypothetical protein
MRVGSGSILLSSLLLLSLLAPLLVYVTITPVGTVGASSTDNWVVASYSPQLLNYAVSVVGAKDNIYIANSSLSSYGGVFQCYFMRYNPADSTWDDTLAVPSGLLWLPGTSTSTGSFKNGTYMAWDNGNYIYTVFGGSYSNIGNNARHYFYRYSISGNSWQPLENTPDSVGQGPGSAIAWVPGSAIGDNENYIFAIVSMKDQGYSFWRYKISNNTWVSKTSPPAETDDGCSLVWTGGIYLYALRGEDIESSPLYDFWRYNIVTNTWETRQNIPAYPHDNDIYGVAGRGGVGDGGSLLWIGGNYSDYIYALSGNQCYPENNNNPIWDNRFYLYTISTDNWSRLADLPRGVGDQNGHRLGFASGKIYYWVGTYHQPPVNGADDKILGAYTPSAGLAAPTLVAPDDGSSTNDNSPTFRWDNSYVADNYEVWVDNNSNFSSPEILENVTENSYTPTTELHEGSYWWRVRAYKGGSASGFSDVWTFTVDITPPTSSVNAITPYWQTSTSFTVTASASDALSGVNRVALWYRYSSDNLSWGSWTWFDNDMASPWSWTFTSPNGNGYYQFYSRARDNAGNEEAAPVAADTICGVDNTPPDAPLLLEPENDAKTDDNTPTFRWAAVTDLSLPVTYTLQVDNDSNFSSPEVNIPGLIENAYTPTSELENGTYYWHVRAVDNAGNTGGWSVTWSLHIGIFLGVEVTITPSENSGLPGYDVNYFIMVKNVGENLIDNYGLTVDDNTGWSLMLVDNFFANVAPEDNRTTTLRVTIAYDAVGGTIDDIIVTATSQTDNTVSGSGSCTAQVIARSVSVSISPSSQSGDNGTLLTYTVTVNNTGNVSDTYTLENTDNAGWMKSLSNTFVVVAPFSNDNTTTLSVTIPSDAAAGMSDNITVIATSQADNTVSDNASCIASVAPSGASINLVAGWNLVGFAGAGSNDTPGNVFAGLTYPDDYIIYYWNAPGGPYGIQGTGVALKDNLGYWVWVKSDNTVSTSGVPPASGNVYLVAGWNLVHFPVVDGTTTPSKIFAGLTYPDDYIIYYWNAPGGPYGIQGTGVALKDNLGYWVWVNTSRTVTVP